MKIEHRRSPEEQRLILRAMLTDRIALARIATMWQPHSFASADAQLVGDWCVEYHSKHNKAPRSAIGPIFTAWSETYKDKDRIKLVSRILASISDENERSQKLDSSYVVELANKVFTRNRLKHHIEAIEGYVELDQLDKAQTALSEFTQVDANLLQGDAVLHEDSIIESCFAVDQSEPLIEFSGALNKFYAHALHRDKFIAFQAPEKAGKTHLLLDFAVRAVMQRNRTLFIGCGDMTQQEMLERLYPRIARHPLFSEDNNWPYTIKIPTKLTRPESPEKPPEVEFKERTFDGPLAYAKAKKACDDFMSQKVRSKEVYFRMACYPNDTISAKGVHDLIKQWEVRGWVPSVVIVDYADILAPIDPKKEFREQCNQTWKYLRRISQELHCLLITATQAKATSYGKKTQDRTDFSEDKRKLAHASGIIGINVTAEEKELSVFRLNWIGKRKGRSSPRQCVYVAGCLDISDPCTVSTF